MSILVKPYVISVWDDVWDTTQQKFVEKRLAIIGTNEMQSQNKVIEPILTRNVNGVKKFSFKMYKRYIDSNTGEEVENPFMNYLISERKVKLHYDNKWYDFIIKNINETSTNYLYSFDLEDSLVVELSKNGFNVVLDQQLNNNMDSANELAKTVLTDTDWVLPENPEKFVQTVEDNLVYLTIDLSKFKNKIYHLTDQKRNNLTNGVTAELAKLGNTGEINVLGFYSCCRNKPYRFQFIYLNDYTRFDENKNIGTVHIDANRVILNEDCQYYFDIINEEDYKGPDSNYGFYLPDGITPLLKQGAGVSDDADTTISYWYRGARYGFAQKAVYRSELNRYVNIYDKNGTEYYGFLDTKYNSPNLLTNVVTNTDFKSTSGWTGASKSNGGEKAKVENVFGIYSNNGFEDATELLKEGTFNVESLTSNANKAYMKLSFDADNQIVINSGPYDNRSLIGNLNEEEEWAIRCVYHGPSNGHLSFNISEWYYKSAEQKYDERNPKKIEFSSPTAKGEYHIFKVLSNEYSEKEFKKKNDLRIGITADVLGDYYIESLELFRVVYTDKNKTKFIIPNEQNSETAANQIVEKKYKYFLPSVLEGISSIEELTNVENYDTPQNTVYVPVFNEGAEKIRSVDAKESNYFNILQSIAETFECWLTLEIERDEFGAIEHKRIAFKNYAGSDNYAAFRYGVNLKDIQRTHESKNIVTKLIVKQNANEHAKNGFCTIQRAESNPTGENCLYDFQYYHNNGLLDAKAYLESIYANCGDITNADTIDVESLDGYMPKLRVLNDELLRLNEQLINNSTDLTKVNADYEVAKAAYDAAESGIEETENSFEAATGLNIRSFSKVKSIELDNTIYDSKQNATNLLRLSGFSTAKKTGDGYVATITKNEASEKDGLVLSESRSLSLQTNAFYTLRVKTRVNEGEPFVEGTKISVDLYPDGLPEAYLFIERDGWCKFELKAGNGCSADNNVPSLIITSTDSKMGSCILRFFLDAGTSLPFSFEIVDIELVLNDGNTSYNDDDLLGHLSGNVGNDITSITLSETKTQKEARDENGNLLDSWYQYSYDFNITAPSKKAGDEIIFYAYPKITTIDDKYVYGKEKILVKLDNTLKDGAAVGKVSDYVFETINPERSDVKRLLKDMTLYTIERNKQYAEYTRLEAEKNSLESTKAALETSINTLKEKKSALNKLFYKNYYRFIQEGTWIDEQYVDDEKYYIDAQSVLYNSCYPQVAYAINVLSLSQLPGYELFTFELGDKTYVEDEQFFGTKLKEEIIIAEMSNYLDNPSQDSIRVQNFKNQFQDLFQKITATVQQTQYNTGSYEKAVALAEADQEKKGQFLTDALTGAASAFQVAGQQSVTQDASGITIVDENAPCNALKMIGGAIMLSKQDANGQQKWTTGLTADGISASLLTAGHINAGNIAIYNEDEPVFKWDAFGLTAYDANWYQGVISDVNTNKFVRFDKFGIYGMNNVDGASWKPESEYDVHQNATFALTWDGLKVTGDSGVVAKIGKQENNIINITKDGQSLFKVSNDGDAVFAGNLQAAGGTFTGDLFAGNTTKGTSVLTIDAKGISIKNLNGEEILKINQEGFRVYAGGTESNAFHINSDGKVTIGSEAGTNLIAVGGFSIQGSSLYTQGKTSLGLDSDGVLIDPEHISLGAYDAFRILNTGDVSLSKISIKPRPAGKPRNILSAKVLSNKERTYTLTGESTFFSSESLKGLISSDKKYGVVFEAKINRENCYVKTDFIPDDLNNSESTVKLDKGGGYQIYSTVLGPLSNLDSSTNSYFRFFWNNGGDSNNNAQIGYTISIRNVMLLELAPETEDFSWTQGYHQADEDTWSLIADSQGLVLNNSPIKGETYRAFEDSTGGWWQYQLGVNQEGDSSIFYVSRNGEKRLNIDVYGRVTIGWHNNLHSQYTTNIESGSITFGTTQYNKAPKCYIDSKEIRFEDAPETDDKNMLRNWCMRLGSYSKQYSGWKGLHYNAVFSRTDGEMAHIDINGYIGCRGIFFPKAYVGSDNTRINNYDVQGITGWLKYDFNNTTYSVLLLNGVVVYQMKGAWEGTKYAGVSWSITDYQSHML